MMCQQKILVVITVKKIMKERLT